MEILLWLEKMQKAVVGITPDNWPGTHYILSTVKVSEIIRIGQDTLPEQYTDDKGQTKTKQTRYNYIDVVGPCRIWFK